MLVTNMCCGTKADVLPNKRVAHAPNCLALRGELKFVCSCEGQYHDAQCDGHWEFDGVHMTDAEVRAASESWLVYWDNSAQEWDIARDPLDDGDCGALGSNWSPASKEEAERFATECRAAGYPRGSRVAPRF